MTLLMIAAIILFLGSLVTSYLGYGWSAIPAFIGLWLLGADSTILIGWGICALVVCGLGMILPRAITGSRMGVVYMFAGAVTGTIIGLMASSAGVVVASFAGTLCGGVAYGATPEGRQMGFPSAKYFNYLAAKGFLYVVTTSIIGVGLLELFAA